MSTFDELSPKHRHDPGALRILILGCGPAGLMAAQGAWNSGADVEVDIVSNKRKSEMFGAQYLHKPIPGISDLHSFVMVDYTILGTDHMSMADAIDQYRRKVYGQFWDGSVSPDELLQQHRAWDIKAAYDKLWEQWQSSIHHMVVHPDTVRSAIDSNKYKYIFNTIPMDRLCYQDHTFRSIKIRAMGDAPDRGQEVPYECEPNTVVCNGMPEPSWYRISNIWGAKTVEWPFSQKVPFQHAEVMKPLGNNCDCFPEVTRIGRYGTWQKGVLSHEAYDVTFNLLAGMS
jgi:hypothetical protein